MSPGFLHPVESRIIYYQTLMRIYGGIFAPEATLKELLPYLNCFIIASHHFVRAGQLREPPGRIIGLKAHRFLDVDDCFLGPSRIVKGLRHKEMRSRIIGPEGDGSLPLGDGLVILALNKISRTH